MTVINREDFISEIERYGQGFIDAKKKFLIHLFLPRK